MRKNMILFCLSVKRKVNPTIHWLVIIISPEVFFKETSFTASLSSSCDCFVFANRWLPDWLWHRSHPTLNLSKLIRTLIGFFWLSLQNNFSFFHAGAFKKGTKKARKKGEKGSKNKKSTVRLLLLFIQCYCR